MTITMTGAAATGEAELRSLERRLVDLGDMAREMFAEVGLPSTLRTVMSLASRTFGCDDVGVLLDADGDEVAPAAATGSAVRQAELMEVEARQGPGLQAVLQRQPVISDELRFDSRWRFWAPQAADLGFRSVLSLRLADGDTSGALTLYSRQSLFFGADVLALGQAFATHASIAIAIARERDQLLQAVDSRGVVGQAQGLLMQQYGISADQAFTVLKRYAAQLDQKLRLVAARFVEDRTLPDLEGGAAWA
jgi:GAF domain-containing protein